MKHGTIMNKGTDKIGIPDMIKAGKIFDEIAGLDRSCKDMTIFQDNDGFSWQVNKYRQMENLTDDQKGEKWKDDLKVLDIVKRLSSKRNILIDIGAGVGNLSIRAANNYGAVCAYEPNPVTAEILRGNKKLNRAENVIIHNCGLWEDERRAGIWDRGEASFLDLAIPAYGSLSVFQHRICLHTLDSFTDGIMDQWINGYVICLDAEGSELQILKGAKKTLARKDIALIIDHHVGVYPGCENNKQEIEEILRQNSFYFRDLSERKIMAAKGGFLGKIANIF